MSGAIPIYLVIWEYDRSNYMMNQYGFKKLLNVFKCDFSEVQPILEKEVFPFQLNRQINYEYWYREPDTNFLRENAKDWK